MNVPFFLLIVLFILSLLFAFSWGARHEIEKHSDQFGQIRQYLDSEIPNEWSAYKKGVHEGYEQGLRDGQDDTDEPA